MRIAKEAGENHGIFTIGSPKIVLFCPKMELYVNTTWTKRYGNAYVAEAIAWSDTGNHATIYTMGITAKEADAKLAGALRELKLISEASSMTGDSEIKTENPGS